MSILEDILSINLTIVSIIVIILLIAYGLYNILLEVFKFPTKRIGLIDKYKIILKNKNKNSVFEDGYNEMTHKIANKIKFSKNIKEVFVEKLNVADIKTTPELFTANIINRAIYYLIAIVLCFPIMPLLSIILIFIMIHDIFKQYNEINTKIKIKQEKIEREIPKFLDFITNSFKFNKNVKQTFESYKKIAGDYLKANIEITIADMQTGNYEEALKRLDGRVNSYSFSKVIRAIIAVVRGDENTQYLQNLYKETASIEYERLKIESEKKIEKVRLYSTILLVCIVVIVFTMLALKFIVNVNEVEGIM